MIYLQLFWEFFKTGLFGIGGGMAALPFLRDISARRGWYTLHQLADMVAVAESTPGPIGINTATYAGYVTAGVGGAVLATLSYILPGVVITILIARLLVKHRDSDLVNGALRGLRPASIGLISAALVSLVRMSVVDIGWLNWKALILAVLALVIMRRFKGHMIIYIAASAVLGIVFRLAE